MHKPVLTSLTMEKTIDVIVSLFRDQAPAQVMLFRRCAPIERIRAPCPSSLGAHITILNTASDPA